MDFRRCSVVHFHQTACAMPAFVAPCTTSALSSHKSPWTCTRQGRPLAVLHRSAAYLRQNECIACASPSPTDAKEEDGEALDELAMRAAEIHEVLKGLEDFKARIVDDATKLAKKVRASKKDLQETLDNHPDIIKIDGHLKELKEELEQIGDR